MLHVVKLMNLDSLVIHVICLDARIDDQSSGLSCVESSLLGSRSSMDDFSYSSGGIRHKFLLGAAWSEEILGVHQKFEGGAEKFRKSLCKYAIHMGFQFNYLKMTRTELQQFAFFEKNVVGYGESMHQRRRLTNLFTLK